MGKQDSESTRQIKQQYRQEQREVRRQNRAFTRSSGYDYKNAGTPDETGHYASRNPDSGLILKGKKHPTYNKTVAGEKAAGMKMYRKNGRIYSKPKR